MKKLLTIFILLTISNLNNLPAEIQKVTVNWRADACDERCARMVERQLKAINGANEVQMFPSGGAAEIYWKPRSQFRWDSINLAMKRVGIKLKEVQVKIRGTITVQGNRYFITSLGDPTRFELLSPSLRSDTEYVVEGNILTHQIVDPLKSRLIAAEKNHQIVTIHGPMFQPYRNPLLLIVDNMTVDNPR